MLFERRTRSYAERCDGDVLKIGGRVFEIVLGDFQERSEKTGRLFGELLGPEEIAEMVGVKPEEVYNTPLEYLV